MFLFSSLIAPALSWIFRTILIKAVVFFTSYMMVAFGITLSVMFMYECCDISLPNFTALFAQVAPAAWWFLDLMNFSVGFRMVICALITSWMIRWIPFSPK